ncbi:hypothetical protein BT69DRAFT_1293232 [Atractiella rhizophila]|nr:hypothetical protein BT69DRAFT_1293232 [Atractiella rhizophila]
MAATGLMVDDYSGITFVNRDHFTEADLYRQGRLQHHTQLPDYIPPNLTESSHLEDPLSNSSGPLADDNLNDSLSDSEEPPTIEEGFQLIDTETCLPCMDKVSPLMLKSTQLQATQLPLEQDISASSLALILLTPTRLPSSRALTVTLNTPINPNHFYSKKPLTIFCNQEGQRIHISAKSPSMLLFRALSVMDTVRSEDQHREGALRASVEMLTRENGQLRNALESRKELGNKTELTMTAQLLSDVEVYEKMLENEQAAEEKTAGEACKKERRDCQEERGDGTREKREDEYEGNETE